MPQSSVVAIGVFDGLHLGHQALTEQTALVAAEFGLRPIALTFNPHPMTVVRGMRVPALTSLDRRIELLRAAGVAEVKVCDFTPERARQTPLQFIDQVLREDLHAKHVVVGRHFRFGHGAEGTVEDFREAGLQVHEIDQVVAGGERVSSTRIREAVADGEVESAAKLLSRPHRYQGIVVGGLKRGRELGYPTANLSPEFIQVAPADGVYAGIMHVIGLDGLSEQQWPAAISVGTNPTFTDVPERVVEAHALDVDDLELYGLTVAVDFVARIRPMVAFGSVAELVAAMAEDVRICRTILATA